MQLFTDQKLNLKQQTAIIHCKVTVVITNFNSCSQELSENNEINVCNKTL